ncbi:MAG: hypothetical protein Q9219_003713 [cf. Caloplaca sp. 3 TL-2023]
MGRSQPAHRAGPSKVLEEYASSGKIEAILDLLFKDDPQSKPSAELVRRFYLRPFVILICAGHPLEISCFLKYQDLRDDHLPFHTCPASFPALSESDQRWIHFYEQQWIFCAVELHYGMGLKLGPRDVLPITRREPKASGASASISTIDVHPDYDKLQVEKVLQAQDAMETSIANKIQTTGVPSLHTYVLKTYETPEAEDYFRAEADGFRILENASKGKENNVISYYGSFERAGTDGEGTSFNTIFELAEYHTLEDFMGDTDPPSTQENLVTFWQRFLEVIRGLIAIHGQVRPDARFNDAVLLGYVDPRSSEEKWVRIDHCSWHQDIKPTNILVCRNPHASSKFDHFFKLADLGLSHFKMHIGAKHGATVSDARGTRTYGAPEAYRDRAAPIKRHADIQQSFDIWSMGCVISEVAIWLAHGYQYLVEYRRRRSDEFCDGTGEVRKDYFHDRQGGVLSIVNKTHRDLPDSLRRIDVCTKDIVEKLASKMILPNPNARPSAQYIHNEAKIIIERATGSKSTPATRFLTGQAGLKLPPNLPPGMEPNPRHHTPQQLSSQGTRPQLQRHFDEESLSDYPANGDATLHLAANDSTTGATTNSQRTTQYHQARAITLHQRLFKGKPMTTLSVEEGLKWKRQRENSRITAAPKERTAPKEWSLNEINGRDHVSVVCSKFQEQANTAVQVFLVDTAESMAQHETQVKGIIELLGYMVAPYDPNGLEFMLTWYRTSMNSKTTQLSKILERLDSIHLRDRLERPNFALPFADIIEKYQRQIKEKHTPQFFRRVSPPRKMSLYVITDGNWQPKCEILVKDKINDLIDTLNHYQLTTAQVGIQFIRVGDDDEGREKLDVLDSGLGQNQYVLSLTVK